MATDNHTAITSGAAANASTFNTPLGQLDAAIGDFSAFSAGTLAAILATAIDTDGTLKTGAVDAAAVLAANVVTTAKILDANVTEAKLASGAVTEAKIADNEISAVKIKTSAVTSFKIATAAVEAAKIAGNAVTTSKILDANVTAAKLASNAVTTAKITDANVTTAKIAGDAVTWAKLAMNANADDETLKLWAAAWQGYITGGVTYDSANPDTIDAATVTWPDGSAGAFSATSIDSEWEVWTEFDLTHTDSGKTVTYSGLVIDADGHITTEYSINVA